VAAGKGKLLPLVPRAALTRPQYRTSIIGGAAAVYELPSPKPPLRTVMVRADTLAQVGRPFEGRFGETIRVVRGLDQAADVRMIVCQPVARAADAAIRTRAAVELPGDTAVVITRPLRCRGDTAQRIGVPVAAAADLHPTVYAVLVDETHVIAT
jgi:hypothetical protein